MFQHKVKTPEVVSSGVFFGAETFIKSAKPVHTSFFHQ